MMLYRTTKWERKMESDLTRIVVSCFALCFILSRCALCVLIFYYMHARRAENWGEKHCEKYWIDIFFYRWAINRSMLETGLGKIPFINLCGRNANTKDTCVYLCNLVASSSLQLSISLYLSSLAFCLPQSHFTFHFLLFQVYHTSHSCNKFMQSRSVSAVFYWYFHWNSSLLNNFCKILIHKQRMNVRAVCTFGRFSEALVRKNVRKNYTRICIPCVCMRVNVNECE